MVDNRSYTHNLSSCEFEAWKNSGLNGIRAHDLCDTSAVLYQLSKGHGLETRSGLNIFQALISHSHLLKLFILYNCDDQS